MHSSSRVLVVALLSSLVLSACNEVTRTDFKRGYLTIQNDSGADVQLTHAPVAGSVSGKKAKKFTETTSLDSDGIVEAPFYSVTQKLKKEVPTLEVPLVLTQIAVSNGSQENRQRLLTVSGAELQPWIPHLSRGVRLRLSKSGESLKAEFGLSVYPPAFLVPVTEYAKPADAIPGWPAEILNSKDLPATLQQLKKIASATDAYSTDLITAVQESSSLDLAHLEMLLDAFYFPNASIGMMQDLLRDMKRDTPLKFEQDVTSPEEFIRQTERNIALAQLLASRINDLVVAAIPKLTDLSAAAAERIVRHLYGEGAAGLQIRQEVFKKIVTQLAPLNAADTVILIRLALAYGWLGDAKELLFSWYSGPGKYSVPEFASILAGFPESEKAGMASDALTRLERISVQNLKDLLDAFDRYNQKGRAGFLLGQAPRLPQISIAELVSLFAYFDSANRIEVFNAFVRKLAGVSVAELVSVLGAFSSQGQIQVFEALLLKLTDRNIRTEAQLAAALDNRDYREKFIETCLNREVTILTADAVALISLIRDGERRDGVITAILKKISDKSNVNVARLFGLLSSDKRAMTVLRYLEALEKLNTEALIAFSNASPERKGFILVSYLDRLDDFTPQNSIRIASLLQGEDRDSVLIIALERNSTVTAAEFEKMVQVADRKGGEILYKNLPKVSDLDARKLARLAGLVSYGAKDTLIAQGIKLLPEKLPAADWIVLKDASYSQGATLLIENLARVSDLDPKRVVLLANQLSYGHRDMVLGYAVQAIGSFDHKELLAMVDAAYSDGFKTLLAGLPKVTDLTVKVATGIVGRLSYGNRDAFLLAAVDLVKDLNKDNLIAFADQAYSERNRVLQKGLDRIAGRPDSQ